MSLLVIDTKSGEMLKILLTLFKTEDILVL